MRRETQPEQWVAEWQQLDGSWERIAGPGGQRAVYRAIKEWRERQAFPPPETRMRIAS